MKSRGILVETYFPLHNESFIAKHKLRDEFCSLTSVFALNSIAKVYTFILDANRPHRCGKNFKFGHYDNLTVDDKVSRPGGLRPNCISNLTVAATNKLRILRAY